MSYQLTEVTIRTNWAEEDKKNELWEDVESGKIPLLFSSEHRFVSGLSPVSKYSRYENKDCGDYDFSIIAVKSDFFTKMEKNVADGFYIKIETVEEDGNLENCAKRAWNIVQEKESEELIQRTYFEDFESSVPSEYTKDKKAHCYLYSGVKK